MGCDIHAYIEYRLFTQHDTGEPHYVQWAHPFVTRDYVLFANLAGPRWESWMGVKGVPKGIDDLALDIATFNDYHLRVSNEPHPDEDDRTCTPAKAAEWVERGLSRYASRFDREYVTHPDWHSASWLDTDELEAVLLRTREVMVGDYSEPGLTRQVIDAAIHNRPRPLVPMIPSRNEHIEAILAAMKVLDAGETGRTRLVFWFDN